MGKTYVIMGGNAGARFQATLILLSKGAKVVMLNRNADKSTAAIANLKEEFGAQANVCLLPRALSNLESMRTAADEVLEAVSQIDAQICNAAIAQVPIQKSCAPSTTGRNSARFTGLLECVGSVCKGTLTPHANDKAVMEKLWAVFEAASGFNWEDTSGAS